MSLFSKSCVYGLRAGLYIVAHQKDRAYVPIREIADQLGVSFHFLTKILQKLTERGILVSNQGPKGGVALARNARTISLAEVIEGIDGPEVFRECVLGLAGCGDRKPCPLHDKWTAQRGKLKKLFDRSNLAGMSLPAGVGDFRLSD